MKKMGGNFPSQEKTVIDMRKSFNKYGVFLYKENSGFSFLCRSWTPV